MSEPSFDVETLLRQRGWLHALARGLVAEGEVDDLVQESWLAALGGGSRPERTLRAWFAGILRNVARRRGAELGRRTELARHGTELAGEPHDERELSAEELVARAELQERLSAAVRALREPYRTTVLLHYFEGLSLEELSRRMGVPGSTGRTRLARALEELRARLDREFGGREAWALALAGVPALGEAGSITGGVLLGTKLKLAAAGLVVALGGVALWRGSERTEVAGARVAEPGAAMDAAARNQGTPSDGVEVAREAAPSREAPAPADPPPAAVAEVLVYGSVLDPAGARVAVNWITLQDESGDSRTNGGSNAGSWSMAGLHPGRWQLFVRAAGHVEHRAELLLSGAKEHERHDLVLEPALAIRIRLVDETGARLPGPYDFDAALPAVSVVATKAPPEEAGLERGVQAGEYRAKSHIEPMPELPAGCSGLLELGAPLPVYVSAVLQDEVLETRLVAAPVEELTFTLERARIEARLGGLRLRLVDALTGAPLAGKDGSVSLGPETGGGSSAFPDEEGLVVFERQPPGLAELELSWKGHEHVERTVRVRAGRVEDLGDFPLSPAATIRGRVVDARGEPVSAHLTWISVAHLRNPLDCDTRYSTSTRDEGRFEITSAARGPVLLRVEGEEHALAVQRVDASAGLVEGVELRVEEGTRVTFRAGSAGTTQVTVADEGGVPLTTWRMSGEGVLLRSFPAGRYELWTGVGERVDATRPLVVGAEPMTVDLGAAEGR